MDTFEYNGCFGNAKLSPPGGWKNGWYYLTTNSQYRGPLDRHVAETRAEQVGTLKVCHKQGHSFTVYLLNLETRLWVPDNIFWPDTTAP